MSVQSKAYLRSRFETGDVPSQQDFIDMIDTLLERTSLVYDIDSYGLGRAADITIDINDSLPTITESGKVLQITENGLPSQYCVSFIYNISYYAPEWVSFGVDCTRPKLVLPHMLADSVHFFSTTGVRSGFAILSSLPVDGPFTGHEALIGRTTTITADRVSGTVYILPEDSAFDVDDNQITRSPVVGDWMSYDASTEADRCVDLAKLIPFLAGTGFGRFAPVDAFASLILATNIRDNGMARWKPFINPLTTNKMYMNGFANEAAAGGRYTISGAEKDWFTAMMGTIPLPGSFSNVIGETALVSINSGAQSLVLHEGVVITTATWVDVTDPSNFGMTDGENFNGGAWWPGDATHFADGYFRFYKLQTHLPPNGSLVADGSAYGVFKFRITDDDSNKFEYSPVNYASAAGLFCPAPAVNAGMIAKIEILVQDF